MARKKEIWINKASSFEEANKFDDKDYEEFLRLLNKSNVRYCIVGSLEKLIL